MCWDYDWHAPWRYNEMITLIKGQKGRLKTSKKEFEIIDVTLPNSVTKIKFHREQGEYIVKDQDLRDIATDIPDWSS
jgi:hypothetical protein